MNATSKTLCGLVAGLALLGTSTLALADQNGKREDRGVQASSQRSTPVQARSNNSSRGNSNQARSDRGSNNVASFNRGDNGRVNSNRGGNDRGHGNTNHGNSGHGNAYHGGDRRDSHHDGGVRFEIHIGSHAPRYEVCRPVIRTSCPPPRPTWAQLEYQRGVDAARCDGFAAGKDAGFSCLPYCDTPTVCLDHVSAYFRSGYLAAYASAYHDGFDAGRTERVYHLSNPTSHRASVRW